MSGGAAFGLLGEVSASGTRPVAGRCMKVLEQIAAKHGREVVARRVMPDNAPTVGLPHLRARFGQ